MNAALRTFPLLFATTAVAAVAAWSAVATVDSGGHPNFDSIRIEMQQASSPTVQTDNNSGLQTIDLTLMERRLRPDLRPPPKPKLPARPTVTVKPVAKPTPPLRINLTLIGTVIEPERSHAVLRTPQGVTLVIRPAEELPPPNTGVKLESVTRNSATLTNGPQRAVIEIEAD